jgi:hypothetical protein
MNSDSPNTADIVERLTRTRLPNNGFVNPDGHEGAAEIKMLRSALMLWLAYDDQDEADFAQAGPMLLYARAIDATRAALKDHRKAQAHD